MAQERLAEQQLRLGVLGVQRDGTASRGKCSVPVAGIAKGFGKY